MYNKKILLYILLLFLPSLIAKKDSLQVEDYVGKVFYKYQMQIYSDSIDIDLNKNDRNNFLYNLNESYKTIVRRGEIYRGFSVGTDKAFGIQSGLDLELDGPLYDDFRVKAVLKDDDFVFNGEEQGATKEVKALENMYVQFLHPNFISHIGDFSMQREVGKLVAYNKQLNGGYLKIFNQSKKLKTGFSVSNSQFKTITIEGVLGKQGPYFLKGDNQDLNINLVRGSEKIYYNGKLLSRGARKDYTIDYLLNQIIFNKIVKDGDKIVVSYEYYQNNYKKNIYFLQADGKFLEKSDIFLQTKNDFYLQRDNYKNPLGFVYNKSIKEALMQAKYNPDSAYTSGVVSVSEGKGNYTFNEQKGYYVYVGENQGNLNISFNRWHDGKYRREYTEDGSAYYIYDKEEGEYAPKRKIPLPESLQSFSNYLGLKYGKVILNSDISITDYKANYVYDKSTKFNGFGSRQDLSYNSGHIKDFGGVNLKLSNKYQNRTFHTIQNNNRIEYFDKAGVNIPMDSISFNKGIYSLEYFYKNYFSFIYNRDNFLGKYQEGGKIVSNQDSYLLHGSSNFIHNYKIQFKNFMFKDASKDYLNNSYFFNSSLSYKFYDFNFLIPSLAWEKKDIKENKIQRKYINYKYGLAYNFDDYSDFYFKEAILFQRKFVKNIDKMELLANILENNLSVNYNYGKYSRFYGAWQHLKTYYHSSDTASTKIDNIELDNIYQKDNNYRLHTSYKIQKLHENQKVRQFYKTEPGKGNYKKIEHPDGSYEFIKYMYGDWDYFLKNSGKDYPVSDLVLTINQDISPNYLIHDTSFLYWLSRIRSYTSLEIREKSKWSNPYDIMFLNLSKFHGDSTVLGEFSLDQSLHLFYKDPLSFRYRYLFTSNYNDLYFNVGKKNVNHKHEFTVFRRSGKLYLESGLSFIKRDINYLTGTQSHKNIREVGFSNQINYNFSYYLTGSIALNYILEENHDSNLKVERYQLKPSLYWSFMQKGVLRLNWNYDLVTSKHKFIDYDLGGGLRRGHNFYIGNTFTYQFSESVKGDVTYTLIKEANYHASHQGRLEIKVEL